MTSPSWYGRQALPAQGREQQPCRSHSARRSGRFRPSARTCSFVLRSAILIVSSFFTCSEDTTLGMSRVHRHLELQIIVTPFSVGNRLVKASPGGLSLRTDRKNDESRRSLADIAAATGYDRSGDATRANPSPRP